MDVRGGGGLDGFQLIFMKMRDSRLSTDEIYLGKRVGGFGGGESIYESDGTPIIGLCGKAETEHGNLGIAPIFLEHTSAGEPRSPKRTAPQRSRVTPPPSPPREPSNIQSM